MDDWCVKLWYDDDRPAPEDGCWLWAKTNRAAQLILMEGWPVDECSLDHDLGEDNGVDFVRWMIERGYVPPKVTIHSRNPIRAKEMAMLLNDAGYDVILDPFKPRKVQQRTHG